MAMSDYRRRSKEYIRACKEIASCSVCEESRAACLDYHHRDPSTKKFAIQDSRGRSIKTIAVEMAKCDVLCANCHRILHAQERIEQALRDECYPLWE